MRKSPGNERTPRGLIGLSAIALLACGSGCASVSVGRGNKKVVLQDFAEGRVVQVAVTDRLTGSKEMLFVSMPQKSLFLEGYIQGLVTDYEDNPIQGVVVRAVAEGEEKFVEKSQAAFQTSSFDAGVSDSNGVYRIRFSLPVIKNKIDIRGKLVYNPGWEQEKTNLGKAYEPQMKESQFRLYFDQKTGTLIFPEGTRKIVVRPVRSDKPPKRGDLPGVKAGEEEKPAASKGEEDMFKDFGFKP